MSWQDLVCSLCYSCHSDASVALRPADFSRYLHSKVFLVMPAWPGFPGYLITGVSLRNQDSLFPALAFTTQGSFCLSFEVENFSVIRLSRHLHKWSTEYIKDKVMSLVCYCCYCYYYSPAVLNPTYTLLHQSVTCCFWFCCRQLSCTKVTPVKGLMIYFSLLKSCISCCICRFYHSASLSGINLNLPHFQDWVGVATVCGYPTRSW